MKKSKNEKPEMFPLSPERIAKLRRELGNFRIVDHSWMPASKVVKPEYYSRVPIRGREKILRRSMSERGFVDPIIINVNPERKNIIIGVQRVALWSEICETKYKFVYTIKINATLEEEKELHFALNQVGHDFTTDDIFSLLGDNAEKFGLSSDDQLDLQDDANYHKRKDELAKENADLTLKWMKLSYKKPEYEEIKTIIDRLKKKLHLLTNSEVIQHVLKNL